VPDTHHLLNKDNMRYIKKERILLILPGAGVEAEALIQALMGYWLVPGSMCLKASVI
jgi:hypothetical protein